MFDRVADGINCDKVVVDDFDSAYDATTHLIKLGSKKIALLSTVNNLSVGKLRFEGYKKALTDANMSIDEGLIALETAIEDFDVKLQALISSKKKAEILNF